MARRSCRRAVLLAQIRLRRPRRPDDDSNSFDQIDPLAIGSGVAGWNDFSGMSAAARESLRSAAGITIPRSNFIAWMLAGYLVVLGPLNWGFFRLIGRIEWAWVAAPVIAILGAVVVTKAAHLNIGFARSQTEIDVVELQPNYARAHLTRYTALYTSLSTSYDIQFDDPHALVQPFAAGGESRLKQTDRTVTLHRDADVRLTDFDVSSNSTAMLHSEQMFDFGGGIALQHAKRPAADHQSLETHAASIGRRLARQRRRSAIGVDRRPVAGRSRATAQFPAR